MPRAERQEGHGGGTWGGGEGWGEGRGSHLLASSSDERFSSPPRLPLHRSPRLSSRCVRLTQIISYPRTHGLPCTRGGLSALGAGDAGKKEGRATEGKTGTEKGKERRSDDNGDDNDFPFNDDYDY